MMIISKAYSNYFVWIQFINSCFRNFFFFNFFFHFICLFTHKQTNKHTLSYAKILALTKETTNTSTTSAANNNNNKQTSPSSRAPSTNFPARSKEISSPVMLSQSEDLSGFQDDERAEISPMKKTPQKVKN